MYFSFRPPPLLYAGLVLLVGTVAVPLQGPDRGESAQAAPSLSVQSQTPPSVLDDDIPTERPEARPTVSSLQARIGLLPRPGGVSLDALVLALLGVGYGIWRLRNAPNAAPQGSDSLSSESRSSTDHALPPSQNRDRRQSFPKRPVRPRTPERNWKGVPQRS